MVSEKNVFRVRLMRWGDSSSSGRTVTLKLPDDTDEHPFKGLPVGAKNGQLMEMEIVLVEGEEDLQTLGPKKRTGPRPQPSFPVASASRSAGGMGAPTVASGAEASGGSGDAPAPDRPATPSGGSAIPAPTGTGDGASQTAPSAGGGGNGSAPTVHASPSPISEPASWRPDAGGSASPMSGGGGGGGDASQLGSYADQMGQAAEALAAVAERMESQVEEEDDTPSYSLYDPNEDSQDPGARALRRAVDLCRAVDKQRAGFFYFMRSLYPQVPSVPDDGEAWSRDAKATRDRVCFHCETTALGTLADDHEVRRKFEELETSFERHERLR